MKAMGKTIVAAILAGSALTGAPAADKPGGHAAADAQALDLGEKAIALRSVRGPDNKTPDVAQLYKAALVAGGFKDSDVVITPVDDTAYLIATWPGSDPSLKPIVISGHMDVVEANPKDWQRDPFKPVVENGMLYGRGSNDMKLDGTVAIATLGELRREGYKPKRTIVIEFSGDEETTMKTSAIIAGKLSNADLVLNIDGGGGVLDEKTGKPVFFTWQGAEKTYADFQLTVTNPGGHSSMPRPDNAIYELSGALVRIGQYQFPPQVNDLTRQSFVAMAKYEDPEIAAALRKFAADPTDKQAIATLTANPAYVGQIGTTCVATMLSGGHALNALPQRATANINCRIFPGVKPADVMTTLEKVAAEPKVTFKDVTEGSVMSNASPMRADFIKAVTDAMGKVYPGVPVFPSMAAGASDSMWFRHNGVPSYGASPMFIKESDEFAHGLNEREPVAQIPSAIDYYLLLLKALTK
jgi:acetylornithine deacetylase/succinyl-diaminopimelate desuccinylase-like protein